MGRGVLEKIVTGSYLVQLFEDKCWLSAENVDQLAKFLQLAECNNLKQKVQQYVDSAISRNLSNHGELIRCVYCLVSP